MKEILLKQIETVEKLASGPKIKRFLNNPYKYAFAILFKDFVYPRNKKALKKTTRLFYGRDMNIYLPASTDIYLTGGKSHQSEIRLAKFIISFLERGDHVLDIGAHYGYFALLASQVVGPDGMIHAYEPASQTYKLLRENTAAENNIKVYNEAVSDEQGEINFYEFPNLYSEYNSSAIEQFNTENWYTDSKPEKVVVPATTIDHITAKGVFKPRLIKIDVEGDESKVISGANYFVGSSKTTLVMEYLNVARGNSEHQKALYRLRVLGYTSYIILASGQLEVIENIDDYLDSEKLESDNIVFLKTGSI